MSHGLWERRFGSDPSIIGRSVRINREDYAVVGVMRASFRMLGFMPQLWTPLTLSAADRTPAARKNRNLRLFARLAPCVTLQQANSQMNIAARHNQKDFPAIGQRWSPSLRTPR